MQDTNQQTKGQNYCRRRRHGEGTVSERADRPGVYRAVFSYKDPVTKKVKRKSFNASSPKKALDAGKMWKKGLESGLKPDADKTTLWGWISIWLSNVQTSLRIKSYKKYESCLRLYVKPTLGNVVLSNLSCGDIQEALNKLVSGDAGAENKEQRLSPFTIRNTRRYLIIAIDAAVKQGLVTRNVARDTKPPALCVQPMRTLEINQVGELIAAANKAGEMIYMAILIAVSTGMRIGEIFGLKWDCVDLESGIIFVKRSLITCAGARGMFQEPKSKQSRRAIPLPKSVKEELVRYKQWQDSYKQSLGEKWHDNQLVFATSYGAIVDTSYFSSRIFKRLLDKAKLDRKVRFHDLRHTHATLLLRQGVHVKVVQERLGHSTIIVTLDTYSHVLKDMQETAVMALEGMLSSTTKEDTSQTLENLCPNRLD